MDTKPTSSSADDVPGARVSSYAVLVWFLRVVMSVASQWVMFNVPETALDYALISGLFEQLILGVLYGLTLQPALMGTSGG